MTDSTPTGPQSWPPRLTAKSVFAELADELCSLDRGLPYTVLRVLRSPGATARRYVEQRDPRLTRPFRLALIVLAICALLLHSGGQSEQFLAGLAQGLREGNGGAAEDGLVAAMSTLFAHFDLMLVACWVPAVALAFMTVPTDPRPNFAEATAFSLYALAGLLPLQLALIVALPALGLQPLWGLLLLPLAWLGWAVYGYVSPTGVRIWSVLHIALLAVFATALLLVLLALAWAAGYAVLARWN
jgi:hypothetical protein